MKTFLVALIIIIGLIISDDFSQLHSGGKTRDIARIIYKEINDTLDVSPQIDKYFKRTKGYILCKKTKSDFKTVSSEGNNSNGLRSQIAVIDEVATLTDFSLPDALKFGQLSVRSPLMIFISTAYTVPENIFKQQCEDAKLILDGINNDEGVERVFSMLFELDVEDLPNWGNFNLWWKASPVQCSFEQGFTTLKEEYFEAMRLGGSKIGEFQSKMLNMWVDDTSAEQFITTDQLKACMIDSYDWNNREVYIGIDLSVSTDNTSIAFATWDEIIKKYVVMAMTFLPEDKREEKENKEKVPYSRYEKQGYCISCKGRTVNNTIDYRLVETYIYDTIKKYNFKVKAIVTDPYHINEMKQNFEDKGYKVLEILQRSTHLGGGTELLQNSILDLKFAYTYNPLLEINFRNAKSDRDYQKNLFIDKKKSNGKIDIVDAIIDCFCMFDADKVSKSNVYETEERPTGFLIL